MTFDLDLALEHRYPSGCRIHGSIQVTAGVLALFGPSGSGKSSLVSCLAGSLRPDQGHLRLNGRTLFDTMSKNWVPPEARNMGLVSQDLALFPHLDLKRNLLYGARRAAGRGPGLDQVLDLLHLQGLEGRLPHQLSGGQRQRVAIGRAVLSGAELLLLDEPVVALDERLRRQIIEDLDRMLEAFGIPAVFVSHDVAEVKWFSDHVAILDEGRLVTCGPTREVLDLAGRRGAVSPVNVVRVDGVTEADGQWSGQLGDQRLCFSPPAAPPKGGAVYLRFEARDLVIAREEIHGLSTRNRLTGRVAELVPLPGGAEVLVGIDCGERLWAELTPAAVRELSLAPGAAVFVHLKSTALKPLG
ncbi:MAG: ATP-binding cassette domain-containing protein [Planctomycetes bacterium]|nr:ATP-binding cassette domain-containing protein [Planctomycetota bacterium]